MSCVTTTDRILTIIAVLSRTRFTFANEADLQSAIGVTLDRAGILFDREVIFDPRNRIDFLIGDIGLEVKVDGSLSSVTRQLHRYAQRPEVAGLLLVTSLKRHDRMPPTMNGKPVAVHHLLGSAL